MLSTKEHALIDYFYSIFLIAMPFILGMPEALPTVLPLIIGTFVLGLNLFTDYELGLVRFIPFYIHLGIDVILGIFLVFSPWLFSLPSSFMIPLVIFGLFISGFSIFTENRKFRNRKSKKYKQIYPHTEFPDEKKKRTTLNEMKKALNRSK